MALTAYQKKLLENKNMANPTTPLIGATTTPPPTAGETRTPPLPNAGATTGATTGGAVPAQVQEAKARAAEIKAQQDQQRALQQAQKNGDIKTVNQILQTQNAQMNPYQATLAAATAPTSTLGGRTEDGNFRLSDGRTFDTLQGAIDANAAGAGGNTAGKPMTNGTGFLAAEGNPGKITYGSVFGNRVTDAEGNTHWLDDDHGYFKSSNGYVYDTNEATDLELARHGLYRTELGGKTVVMAIPDNLAGGFAKNWDKLEADHIQRTGSLPLTPDELYGPDDNTGVHSGGNGNIPSAPSTSNYAADYTSRTPTNTRPTNNQPVQPTNNQPVQNTQPSQPTVTPGSYQPTPSDTVNIRGGDQNSQNIYQQYLDQWEYPDAPEWNGTEYERQRDELLQNAMNPYEGSPYDQQRDDALAQYGEKWQGSEYQPRRDAALERAENMQWNYDPNTDPVWQALQKQYRREGDRATQEAMAQAAMRTWSLANSYAVTAASQAGDYYAAQLSDRLPQLYQDAYQRYLQEFQRQMGISDQYAGFDDREYSRWADQQGKNLDLADRYNQYGQQDYNRYMDRVSQQLQGADRYNQYGGTEYQRYLDQLGQYNTDRNFSYGRYRDAVGDYRYDDETQYARNYQAQRDAILDNRADREWAQQLREYADAQNWKATEWEQYLREYGDQLSEKQRQWAYQMQRDAVEDERWERQYADQRSDTMYDRALQEDQTAYQRALYDQEYADQRGDTAWEQGYKQTAYNDEMERTALNYLNTNGIVTGRYAEILGVPDGTTYEQYYSRYLGGVSSSPFDETEIPSGTTPKYTPPPGDNPPGDTPPDNTGNGRTWWNGRPMTDTAYDLQSRIAYGWAQKTLTKENVQRMVYDAARKGYIEDYEIPLLMRIIGVNIQGPPQQNPNVEGPITQWTK